MTISVLQAVFADDAGVSGTTLTVNLTNVAAGSCIAIFLTDGGNAGTVSVSDPTNGAYVTTYDSFYDATANQRSLQCRHDNVAHVAGTLTITGTWTVAAQFKGICAVEVGGCAAAPLDGHTSVLRVNPGTATDAISVGPPSPDNANAPALVLALGFNNTGSTSAAPAAGTGYTSQGTGWGFGGSALARLESLRTTVAAAAATFTDGTAGNANNFGLLVSVFDESGATVLSSGPAYEPQRSVAPNRQYGVTVVGRARELSTFGVTRATSGEADATTSATGTLTGAGSLSGTAAATTSASGTLTGAGTLSGTAAATTGATGTLTGAGALNGEADATTSATGTLTRPASTAYDPTQAQAPNKAGPVTVINPQALSIGGAVVRGTSGEADATTAATGALAGSGALSGTAAATTSATATLTGAGVLSGTAAATASATGTLSGAGALSGTAGATAGASGILTGSGALNGTAAAQGGASGILTGAGALSGEADATTSASGNLGALPTAGLVLLQGPDRSGPAKVIRPQPLSLFALPSGGMLGQAAAIAAAIGTLAGAGALSGTAAAATSATATLAASGALAGEADGIAGASATLTGAGALSGTAGGSGGASGGAGGGSGAGATTSASGTLAGTGALSGVSAATCSAFGTATGFPSGVVPYIMPLFVVNLPVDQYADFSYTFTWQVGGPGGRPVDLTGAHARFMVRQSPTDGAPILSLTDSFSPNGQILLGGASGQVTIQISRAQTATLVPPIGPPPSYDLFIDWPNGTTSDVLAGAIFIRQTNTH